MADFVKSVEYVEITLSDATATSVNLTKSQTIANCAPFYTINLDSSVSDPINRRAAEVYFESGPKVTAKRDNGTGVVIVGVFVVEFDTTGNISVQQGTFTMTGASSTTEAITSVTTTKAFVIISYGQTSTLDDWNHANIKVVFNSSTELGFSRIGSSSNVSGRYFVVDTSGTDFSVIHTQISMASTDELTEATISAVTLASTFMISTDDNSFSSDDDSEGCVVADIKDTTTIRARRAFNDFGDDTADHAVGAAAVVETQVVSAGGSEFSVEQAECDWGNSLTEAVTINEINQTKAIVVAGGYQGKMSSAGQFSENPGGDHAIMKFTADTTMTGTRATNTTPDGVTTFEVVEFGLVAAGVPSGLALLGVGT